ncbi:MAG: GT4 family glycosyltransferase PelF [Gammaproteobacteria bacterium]|nr:GT4 family glycosyltransferase PelF [Gammaproteobacteria bacterium]
MIFNARHNPNDSADVCLILEGTYPFVRGGVSTWVKQLIDGMPDLTFSIIFLGGVDGDYSEPAYDIPDNVLHIEVHLLLGTSEVEEEKKPFWKIRKSQAKKFELNDKLHRYLRVRKGEVDEGLTRAFAKLLTGKDSITEAELQTSKFAWNTIREKYSQAPAGLDFNHYFWTVRAIHSPLFKLADVAKNAPKADVYHSVSTGYAGFLGALLSQKSEKPYVVSEHGIYTKEREIDLAQVSWIPEQMDPFRVGLSEEMNYLRQVWIRFFQSLGRMTYASADRLFTLYEGNRQRQLEDGAPADKLTIIPNGVDVPRYRRLRRTSDAAVPPVLALIGRVVPIKDIKNFIRAMRIVSSKVPNAQGWIIGPQDEDPAYTQECKTLVESLDLGGVVKFLGFQNPDDIFPKIGLTVLTSVSEGQPLVVLEGYAAGIPTITTDVGSCRELVLGLGAEDEKLGPAGAVVPIANPAAFATSAIDLLLDRTLWQESSKSAIARVEKYYDQADMIGRYRSVYMGAFNGANSWKEAS